MQRLLSQEILEQNSGVECVILAADFLVFDCESEKNKVHYGYFLARSFVGFFVDKVHTFEGCYI